MTPPGTVKLPRTIGEVIARMISEGTLTLPPEAVDAPPAAAPPAEVYGPPQASDIVPGHQKLTYGVLAQWEVTYREVKARNAALLAQSVLTQRAELAAARAKMLGQANATLAAELASIADHRARARAWAAAHPGAGDRLEEYQAAARAKGGEL